MMGKYWIIFFSFMAGANLMGGLYVVNIDLLLFMLHFIVFVICILLAFKDKGDE